MIEVTAKTPGSCGELVQGKIVDQDFLITCPINLYSYVTVRLRKAPGIQGPREYEKIYQALEGGSRYLGYRGGLEFACRSELPRGKGMASSSADLISALAAFSVAVGSPLTLEELAQLCAKVEPTDGLMYPGSVCFDHLQGRLLEVLPSLPCLELLILDLGGALDTHRFNGIPNLAEANKQKESMVAMAKLLVTSGFTGGDLGLLGSGVTLSTLAHQAILPKASLETIIAAFQGSAHGIINSHSGTILGVLVRNPNDCLHVAARMKHEGKIKHYYHQLTDNSGIQIKVGEWANTWQKYPTYMEATYSG